MFDNKNVVISDEMREWFNDQLGRAISRVQSIGEATVDLQVSRLMEYIESTWKKEFEALKYDELDEADYYGMFMMLVTESIQESVSPYEMDDNILDQSERYMVDQRESWRTRYFDYMDKPIQEDDGPRWTAKELQRTYELLQKGQTVDVHNKLNVDQLIEYLQWDDAAELWTLSISNVSECFVVQLKTETTVIDPPKQMSVMWEQVGVLYDDETKKLDIVVDEEMDNPTIARMIDEMIVALQSRKNEIL